MTTLRQFIEQCKHHSTVIDISDDMKSVVIYDEYNGIKVRHI
jgi:hypothetical protein